LPIFLQKIGVFLKIRCYDQIFAKSSNSLSKKRQYFPLKISPKIFLKIVTSVPGQNISTNIQVRSENEPTPKMLTKIVTLTPGLLPELGIGLGDLVIRLEHAEQDSLTSLSYPAA
jgi:hypothetical protein